MVEKIRQSGRAFGHHWSSTTFKREAAMLAFFVWCGVTIYYFTIGDPARITALGPAYSTMTTMVYLYMGSAFGMDFYAKQLPAAKATGG